MQAPVSTMVGGYGICLWIHLRVQPNSVILMNSSHLVPVSIYYAISVSMPRDSTRQNIICRPAAERSRTSIQKTSSMTT